MGWLKSDLEFSVNLAQVELFSSDPVFSSVFEKIKKWLVRFPHFLDATIFKDLCLLHLITTAKYRTQHQPNHLFRLVLFLHLMQKKLLHSVTCFPEERHLELRWFPTTVLSSASSKSVMGCLVGYNVLDRYEVFDEENIFLALLKFIPGLALVETSPYCHPTPHKNIKLFYLEIESENSHALRLLKQEISQKAIAEKMKNAIQPLCPAIFMGFNEEEHYKHILTLSQEIQTLHDSSQAYITFEEQSGKDVTFRVILVHVLPSQNFSLKKCFLNCSFIPERVSIVKHIANHPIEAQVFCLRFPREHAILRSDGSLDFYAARKKVVDRIRMAIGEFRDFNGGIIIQRQALLHAFKEHFLKRSIEDPELLDSFFYAITPVEKQILLSKDTLCCLFEYFLKLRDTQEQLFSFTVDLYSVLDEVYLIAAGNQGGFKEAVSEVLQEAAFISNDVTYAFVESSGKEFFTCIFFNSEEKAVDLFVSRLNATLHRLYQKSRQRQVLRIGMEYSSISLDPRIGGDTRSCDILKLLFEGLTRIDQNGEIENALAESIAISSNLKEYTFHLRPTVWNDGTPVTAHDFVYAWKSILDPRFETAFDYLFYPIVGAFEIKSGKLPVEKLGVSVLNDYTLKIELVNPIHYFLQLTAHPIYSPVHRAVDQKNSDWPDKSGQEFACNGPFILKINRPHQGYHLVKNPFYWDPTYLALDQITMTLMNPAQAVQAFRSGELDWIGNPLGEWYSFFHHGNEEKVLSFRNAGVSICLFNTESFPFSNKKLRLAISYAIDRAHINNKAFVPLTPAHSPLLPHVREINETVFPEYDSEMAKTLFREGLDEMEIDVHDIPPLNFLVQEKGIREYLADEIVKELERCFGIRCILKAHPRHTYFKKMISGDFHMGIILWSTLVEDPSYTLNVYLHRQNGINFSRWEDEGFQKAIQMREQILNPLQRSQALFTAEKILADQAPIIPLFYHSSLSLVKAELQANYKAPGGRFNLAKSFYQKGV